MFSSWGHTFLIIKVSFHSLSRLCVMLVSRPLRSWVSDTTCTFCTSFPQFHDRPPIPLDVLDLKWHPMAILDEISGVAWRTLKPYVCLSRVNQYNGTVCNLGRTHVTSWLAFFLWPSLTAHSEFSSEQIVHVCPLGRVFLNKATDDNIKEWGRSKFPESCVRFHIGDQRSMRLKHTTVQYAKCLV